MKFIIPAREGSKGLPYKNRKLFKYTSEKIPKEFRSLVWVLTDDFEIKKMAIACDFNVWDRDDSVSGDLTSTKELMVKFIDSNNISNEDLIVLYLTYPERNWSDIESILSFYKKNNLSTLLCKKEIDVSPFLILKEEENNMGSQLFYHNLYRRQDYPKCFEISHFVFIFNSKIILLLNNNMYNTNTYYYPIDSKIDVDTQKDFDKLK
jgi:CMP-N-acetylneuraminic acid synthetase